MHKKGCYDRIKSYNGGIKMLDKNIDETIEIYGKITDFLEFLEKEEEQIKNKE